MHLCSKNINTPSWPADKINAPQDPREVVCAFWSFLNLKKYIDTYPDGHFIMCLLKSWQSLRDSNWEKNSVEDEEALLVPILFCASQCNPNNTMIIEIIIFIIIAVSSTPRRGLMTSDSCSSTQDGHLPVPGSPWHQAHALQIHKEKRKKKKIVYFANILLYLDRLLEVV